MGLYMTLLGVGLGLVMQILITAVQNAVDPSDIGAATAGANFFRSIGGSFGTAIFGALYANELPHQLASAFKGSATGPLNVPPSHWTPTLLRSLPASELSLILRALSNTIQDIFRWAAPVGAVAVVLSLTLPEITLRAALHPIADEVPMSNADPVP
jgi:hypothetical protein